jgi:PAS domain S-box-containing protein
MSSVTPPRHGLLVQGPVPALVRRLSLRRVLLALAVCGTFAVYRHPAEAVSSAGYLALMGAVAVAAWVGALRAPRSISVVPVLIASGLTASSIGDLIWCWYALSGAEPDASLADVFYLAAYVGLAGALFVTLVRSHRSNRVDVDALIDALTVTVVSVLALWSLSIHGIVADGTAPAYVRTIWAAYPLLDAILLALVVRAVLTRRGRSAVGPAFAVGVASWLVADVSYLLMPASATVVLLQDLGWIVGAALMAAATWSRPGMPRPLEPRRRSSGALRLLVAVVPLLVPPALELVSHLYSFGLSPFQAPVATSVLLVLAYVRMLRLVRSVNRAEAEAQASRRHYFHLAANSSDAVIVVGADGRVRAHSPQLVALAGFPGPSEGMDWVAVLAPYEPRPLESEFTRLLSLPGEVVTTEVAIDRGTPNPAWLSVRMVNMLDDPDVEGVVVALGDISERKQTEFDLAVARDAALEASRAKSSFLATVSHEIRTPMNGVTGLTGLLLTTRLDQRQHQYADGIRKAGDALLAIIDDVLDFSKGEAGKVVLEQIDFDLTEVVGEIGELVAEGARAKGLELLAYCSPELPLVLRGDPSRLRQVLLNLASNAVKFTERGEVVISAHLESEASDRTVVRFEVTDTGIGLEEENREALFSPFTQADSSTTRQYGGTGLGLAICRQLVTAMGGELGVQSTLGQGSTFWFAVPLEPVAGAATAADFVSAGDGVDRLAGMEALVVEDGLQHAAARRRPQPAAPSTGASRTRRGRLLVVEDNEINQLVAVGILDHLGFVSEVAGNGREALSLLEGSTFDAVLMDCQMPEMDGFQATVELRHAEAKLSADAGRRVHTPVIAMTAGAVAGDRERCLAAGMDDYVAKPVDPAELEAALRRCLPDSGQ